MWTDNETIYSYAFYAMAVAILAAGTVLRSAACVAVSAVLLASGAVYLKAGRIINNALIRHSLVVEMCGGYRVGPDPRSATRREGGLYRSVSAAVLRIGNAAEGIRLEPVLSSISLPFDYLVRVRQIDARRFIESLETKKRLKEIAVTRTDQKRYDRLNELRREIEIIGGEIGRVTASKPIEALAIVRSSAESKSEPEASKESVANVERVASVLSGSGGIDYEVLEGEELLEAVGA